MLSYFSGSKANTRKIDSQQSASGSKDITGKIDSQQSESGSKANTRKIDSQQSASFDLEYTQMLYCKLNSIVKLNDPSSCPTVSSSSLDGSWLMEVSYQYVAAIDFGTTYSGVAFSTRVDQMSIFTCDWKDSDLTSSKTPTSVLLNKQKEFRLTLHTEINEEGGKKMKALDVFCIAIKYLKEQVIKKLQSRFMDATDNDVRFVLTVPSLWSDEAKIFMKAAAGKAGIDNDHLILALEPVAASIYCHELRLDFDRRENKFLPLITPGMKLMVIDLGGGTADISVHKCQKDETLEEVIPLLAVPGERLKDEELEDYFHLLHDFEIKKRSIKPKVADDKDIVMQMDVSLMDLIKDCRGGISSHIKKSKYKDLVSTHGQKLHIKADIFRTLLNLQ
ncbi:unnamed protein product [Mytilus edulis]|uniref:Uncharacterized protein n=1 Tax=Mytilus edulis TaxID=6550 RepID=A0A8S3SII7_MYTED|nr:unnamed protein product [Mytilus edulis]